MHISAIRRRRQATTAFLAPAFVILLGSASVLAVLGQYTDVDIWLADLHFDPVRQLFPWDRTWFARNFMHGWVKKVIVWFGFILIAAMVIDFLRPQLLSAIAGRLRLPSPTPLARVQLRVLGLSAILEPTLIRALKEHAMMHCPWALDRYGGSEPFLRLLDKTPEGWHAGHCFPAGHASSGMWLSALAVLWLPHSPKKALAAFVCGSAVGLALGWVQQMRGQHFLTHTLWTAWLASLLLLVLLALFFHRQLPVATPTVGNHPTDGQR